MLPDLPVPKPEVFGGIYRLRERSVSGPLDPRGAKLLWRDAAAQELVGRLSDPRFEVRQRAATELASLGDRALPALERALPSSKQGSLPKFQELLVWTAARINTDRSRRLVRQALQHAAPAVRQVAAHAVSVSLDQEARKKIETLLGDDSLPVRRAAAEALGRIGTRESVNLIFAALDAADDRVLEHSLTYALIELDAGTELQAGLTSNSPKTVRAALTALVALNHQIVPKQSICKCIVWPGSEPVAEDIRHQATLIAARTPQWGDAYARILQDRSAHPDTASQACMLLKSKAVRNLVFHWLASENSSPKFIVSS